jgi:hypothetical protein
VIDPVLTGKVITFEKAFSELCGKFQLHACTRFGCVGDVVSIHA